MNTTQKNQAFVMEPLQKVSKRLEGLEAELNNRDDRIDKVEERIKQLEAKFDEISAHLKQLAPQPDPARADEEIVLKELVLDTHSLIARAMAEARQCFEDDQKSIALHLKNAEFWLERGKKLKPMIEKAADAADEAIANIHRASEILESLGKQPAGAQHYRADAAAPG